MKQHYHTIIKPDSHGAYVGWVEEIPGAMTQGRTIEECRQNLKSALELMIETHREEARVCLDESCILGDIEIDIPEPNYAG